MDIVNGKTKDDNIKSSPKIDGFKIVNIYFDKDTGKVIVEYDDNKGE